MPHDPNPGGRGSRVRGWRLILAGVLFAGAAAWALRPDSNPSPPPILCHFYGLLADSFLQGKTSLAIAPSPELLALSDPYDPALNRRWRVGDASLFRSKYYLYFGPGPAAVLFAPFKLITGRELPQGAAAFFAAAAGLAALGAWIFELGLRRGRVSQGSVAATLFTTAVASWLPVTLQRCMVFEVAIVCAAGAYWVSLFSLWRVSQGRRPAAWSAALGLCLAFAIASRITYLPAALILLGALAVLMRSRGGLMRSARCLAVAALPVAAAVAALLAYNHARFGNWLEFGQRYQLNFSYEQRINPDPINPGFIPFNLREYLIAAPTISRYFPFILPQETPAMPDRYIACEGMHGILIAMPIHLFAALGLAWAFRRRGRDRGVWAVAAATSACAAAGCLVLLCFKGTTSRYITEFLAPVLPLTALGVYAAWASGRRMFRWGASSLALYSTSYVFLASAGVFNSQARLKHPRTFSAAAHLADEVVDAIAGRSPPRIGGIELAVEAGPYAGRQSAWLLSGGRPDMRFYLTATREDADRISVKVQVGNENDRERLWLSQQPDYSIQAQVTGSGASEDPFVVRLSAPWLYPPGEDGYWDRAPARLKEDLLGKCLIECLGEGVAVLVPVREESDGRPPQVNPDPEAAFRVVRWRYLDEAGGDLPWAQVDESVGERSAPLGRTP